MRKVKQKRKGYIDERKFKKRWKNLFSVFSDIYYFNY